MKPEIEKLIDQLVEGTANNTFYFLYVGFAPEKLKEYLDSDTLKEYLHSQMKTVYAPGIYEAMFMVVESFEENYEDFLKTQFSKEGLEAWKTRFLSTYQVRVKKEDLLVGIDNSNSALTVWGMSSSVEKLLEAVEAGFRKMV